MDKKRRIFSTTGCYGTGSSAVTDFIKEFEEIDCKSDYEIRFIHDPDGISDLEYNLVENPNRHNTSHSLKRFIKNMRNLDHIWFIRRYRKRFGDAFLKAVDEYVQDLALCEYKSAWHFDVYERGKLYYIASRISSHLAYALNRFFGLPVPYSVLLQKEKAYLCVTEEEQFLEATRKFTSRFIQMICAPDKQSIFLDQLVPPSNFRRYARYFEDLRAVLVERDPRDIYLLEKLVWRGSVAPTERVEDFCAWYRWTRRLYEKEALPECVLAVRFEDLVYRYEETAEKIMSFFGLEPAMHVAPKKYFNPDVSIGNTQLWNQFLKEQDNVDYIEKELQEYCYPFPKINQDTLKKRGIF